MQCRRLYHQLGYPRSVPYPLSPWPVIRFFLLPLTHNVVLSFLCFFCNTDENKSKIAKSGALVPLTRLARSKDMRVQRNATGALLNMTHSGSSPFVDENEVMWLMLFKLRRFLWHR